MNEQRLAPSVERIGVLNRVKVALATLAADATLTRLPRAYRTGTYRSEPKIRSLRGCGHVCRQRTATRILTRTGLIEAFSLRSGALG